jgi:hypothetical protein
MNAMNETGLSLRLREFMADDDGWGRPDGRLVYAKLIEFVEANAGTTVFRVSLKGVKRLDISFASETVVECARRHRGRKGFCFVDLTSPDMRENWDAAAQRAQQPLMCWNDGRVQVLGPQPSPGTEAAFKFTAARGEARASEFAKHSGASITNASTKFKQLWEQGYLLRREVGAESGGLEFEYFAIR